ncbi:MAG: hypothetical protein ACXAC5_03305 [Promethearchaeota archaeon]|jgi:hypothetical protein
MNKEVEKIVCCRNCLYGVPKKSDDWRCYLNPPAIFSAHNFYEWHHPKVAEHMYCSHFHRDEYDQRRLAGESDDS